MDADGTPVVGATVQALPITSYLHRLRQRPIYGSEEWLTVKTNDKGYFEFSNLPADASVDFWIKVTGRDLYYHYTPHLMNAIGYEVGKEDLELVLPHGTTIEGKVIEKKTRKGISGVLMLLQVQNVREEQCQRYKDYELVSGRDGVFSIRGVPSGKHILRVVTPFDRTAEWVARTMTLNVTGIEGSKNVTMEIEKGAMLEVLVRNRQTEQPLKGIQTFISDNSPGSSKENFYKVFTGADGFARTRVLPGRYAVEAYNGDYVRLREKFTAVAYSSRPSRLSIMLESRQRVRGSVLEVSGQPASGKIVSIYPSGHTVFTDQYGRFETKLNNQHPTALLGVRDVERNLAGLTNIGSRSDSVRVELKPALSITGIVTDSNEAGIPAARVRLTMEVAGCLCFVDEVITNNKGRYRIDAVVPEQIGSDYKLSVNASGYGPVDYKRISVKGDPGKQVDIPPIKLVPANVSISGVVVDKSGNPAGNIPIFVHGHQRFDQPERTVATDSKGRFKINRICKGPLKLQASFASSPGGSGNLYAQGGDKDVRIVLGQNLVHTAYTSLVGKSLPDISGFGFEPMLNNTDNKRLLICFFHFDQRPSRYCVGQLKMKARELQEQGVYVVFVQASQLPKKILNDWRSKERITLPIGIVRGDEIETRQKWAVESLPWLILTDRDRIVTAEGFSLTELSEKIKER